MLFTIAMLVDRHPNLVVRDADRGDHLQQGEAEQANEDELEVVLDQLLVVEHLEALVQVSDLVHGPSRHYHFAQGLLAGAIDARVGQADLLGEGAGQGEG